MGFFRERSFDFSNALSEVLLDSLMELEDVDWCDKVTRQNKAWNQR